MKRLCLLVLSIALGGLSAAAVAGAAPSGSASGGADFVVEPGSNGQCADVGRFKQVFVVRVDCADGQHLKITWLHGRGCKPTRAHPSRTCTVTPGFRCRANRRATGGAAVRCTRRTQSVRFVYLG